MFESIITDVNWLATLVGALVSFALGALWYSPKMFGKKWMEGVGIKDDGKGPMFHALFAQGVGTFMLAWVIGVVETTGATMLAILIALAVSALIKANGLWVHKSKYAIVVESAYILVMVALMIGAHAIL